MNRALPVCFVVLLITGIASADIGDTPDQTLLWGQYQAVRVVDGYALALADEGVAVCRWDEELDEFIHTNQLIIKDRPHQMRVFDDVLVVRTLHDSLVLVDVGSLPDIARLGALRPGVEFGDFVLHESDLYISVWFRGVWRFTGPSFDQMSFADSVMKPILCSQMYVENHTLHILDEYNGMVRYDVHGPGFGRLMDYMWIPFRASRIFPLGDRWLVSRRNHGLYLGEYGRTGSGIIEEIGSALPAAQRAWATDSLLITATDRFAYVYHRQSHDSLGALVLNGNPINGDVTYLLGEYRLVLPGAKGGLVLYSLEHLGDAEMAYYRPGPIAGLVTYDNLLFTGGLQNPVDAFALDNDGLDLHHTLFKDLTEVVDLARNGDSLLVLYGGLNKIAIVTSCDDPDSAYIESSFFVEPIHPRRIEWHPDWPRGMGGLTVLGENEIAAYTLTSDTAMVHSATWSSTSSIEDAVRIGPTLAVSTSKRNILLYQLDDSLHSSFIGDLPLAAPALELTTRGGRLVYFTGKQMHFLNVDDPALPATDTVIDLAMPVTQVLWRGDRMYTVGAAGIAVYDWSGEAPVLIDSGGMPGTRIAVEDDLIVTTGGGSVNYYHLGDQGGSPQDDRVPALFSVAQNYPNPFNSRTVIQFELSKDAPVRIDIFNALGQRVQTLTNRQYAPGRHSVVWSGLNTGGTEVASGVYFYRVQSGSQVTSRKMVLLK